MTNTLPSRHHQINAADRRRSQSRSAQILFAGAAAVAMFALFQAARPGTAENLPSPSSVRLADAAYPQTPPGLNGRFATDSDDDQAQLQQQIAQQEMLQAEQQAEEQNEQAQQQFIQDQLQAQQTEIQANQ